MDLGRVTFYQEYLAPKGTIVKPYYWLTIGHSCTKCPYHIRTCEEARVSYKEFQDAFGFPMRDPNNHLIFYELRHYSGKLIQKGRATNCTEYDIHPESMLFEMGSYLDSMVYHYKDIIFWQILPIGFQTGIVEQTFKCHLYAAHQRQ
ncbi:UNVERIFIED_CONTAM: putative C-_U-editing enzyme APOB-4 [Gekko kuhli]